MKQKILAVCDLEETYALRMAEYLTQKASVPYSLHIFTKTAELENFMKKNDIFVLLIGESAAGQLKEKPEIPHIFVLWEGGKKGTEDYRYIDKYQKPESVIREAAAHMTELKDWNESWAESGAGRQSRLKAVGIYSPVRRCLQTSFALTMGQLLAKNVNGLDFIPPGRSGFDMQNITGEQWLELLQEIEKISGYEYLILDLTDGMGGLFELLSYCFRIYTITKDDGFAMAKMNQYEQALQLNALNGIAEKTVKCRFPVFEKLPADFNLMTHGELAGYARAIIREDLYGKQAV